MALSKTAWFEKLSSWVPSWFFASSTYQDAEFRALAAILSMMQYDVEAILLQTFICESDDDYLALHGSERSIVKAPNDNSQSFAARIVSLTNPSTKAMIQALIDASLNNGNALLIENALEGFLDADTFCDDTRLLDITKNLNWLTVVAPAQTDGDVDQIRIAVSDAIEGAKAFGVAYDVLYE